MADTKLTETIAVARVVTELSAARMLVLEPKFDRNGADLIVLSSVTPSAKVGILQCKHRSVKNGAGSHVSIPRAYVNPRFFVFLYLEDSKQNYRLFFFTAEEISRWTESGDDFLLSIPKEENLEKFQTDRLFQRDHCDVIRGIIEADEAPLGLDEVLLGPNRLLSQLMDQWAEHGFLPTAERILGINTEAIATLREAAWLFLASYRRADELRFRTFSEPFAWLADSANVTESVLPEKFEVLDIWDGWANDVYWSRFLVATLVTGGAGGVLPNHILYGFVRDSEGEGVDILVPADSTAQIRINHVTSGAKQYGIAARELLDRAPRAKRGHNDL